MPFIPVPNTCQIDLIQQWQGQVVENVLHYTKASPWSAETIEELCAGIVSQWPTSVMLSQSDQLQLTEVRGTDLASATGPVVNFSLGLPLTGNLTSPSMPNNVTCVVTKRTALRGRSYRGRIYHCGLTEGQIAANQLTAGTTAQLLARWGDLQSIPITADEGLMVVVSRVQGGVPLTTGIATLVSGFTCDGVVDSQRRRLPGRGA